MATHREEFLYVPHVDHRSALIAWGAFYLKKKKPRDNDPADSYRFELLDDDELKDAENMGEGTRDRGSIGRNTNPFGAARVRVGTGEGAIEWGAWREVGNVTFAWVRELQPNTRYHYEVEVGGSPWGRETRSIRMSDENDGISMPSTRPREYTFETFPAPKDPVGEFTFAVIGDPGTGDDAQFKVGKALADLIEPMHIRFVLTTGDNIYMKTRSSGFLSLLEKGFRTISGRTRMTGDEDDDWFASYFLPYRDVISRVPVFPCLGNHDSENTEDDDDLSQLADNLYLEERFPDQARQWRLGFEMSDTLFYRFRFGRDAEFVSVDTSFTDRQDGAETLFELTRGKRQPPLFSIPHREFIDNLLAEPAPQWRVPFAHHPPFSLGPAHGNNPVVRNLAKRFAEATPRTQVWFFGHEHNFQHHREGKLHFVLSGAAGKCSELDKNVRTPGHACCHNSERHFLLVTVKPEEMRIRLIDEQGGAVGLTPCTAFPPHEHEEIVITA